jgi:iron-sulfur cluster repair protein YtfE (RIC family)
MVNSYHYIHNAIGGELLKLEEHARTIDPSNPESVGGFAGHLGMLTGIQDSHSHEEENGVWPLIEAKIPGLTNSFLFDHEGERKYIAEIRSALGELQQGNGDKEASKARLYRNTVALSSHLIHHMAKEEAQLYSAFADKMTEAEEGQLIHEVYQGLPNELIVQAMPWWASYQSPEGIVEEAATLRRWADPEKARLILSTVANSLPPEKWSAVEKLEPQLAEYRSAS